MNWLQYRLPSVATYVRAWFWTLPDGALLLIAVVWTFILIAGWIPIVMLAAMFFLLEPGTPL